MKADLNLGVIGNCVYNALIDHKARVVWCCLPRFDGDPVFCDLLRNGGDGNIGKEGCKRVGCRCGRELVA